MVGLVVAEEVLVEEHPAESNQTPWIAASNSRSRRPPRSELGMENCVPGFPGDLAGVVRVHHGRRVHRAAPAAATPGRAVAGEEE